MEENGKMSLQHYQLPNDMTKNKKLGPNDLLVYLNIKSFMNGKTKDCFPSLKKICEKSDLSVNTVRACIANLISEKYMWTEKFGRGQKYYFSSYKNFEVFSPEFLKKEDISSKEKGYVIASQQHMYKDVNGFGKISYSNEELSELINISVPKIKKYDNGLMEKGYLELSKSEKKDIHSGLLIENKFFRLDELGQAVVFVLQNHEKRISDTEKRSLDNEKRLLDAEKNNKWMLQKMLKEERKKKEEEKENIKQSMLM